MSGRDKEYRAFRVAKLNVSKERRSAAFMKISRRGLLMRLVNESEFSDIRIASLQRLSMRDVKDHLPKEQAFYLGLALKNRDPEVRRFAIPRVSENDRDKLISSPYADVRIFLAQNTSSHEILLSLWTDKDPSVRDAAEKSLDKKGLRNSRAHSVN